MYTICLWLFCAFCVVSCRQEFTGLDDEVAVMLRLSSPGVKVDSRGVGDDPKNEEGTWSTDELLADGSCLYRVTLLVVDNNNRLVGYQDWDGDDFKALLPTEVSTEIKGLKANTTYRMIAVANYSAYGESWTGLAGFPDLTGFTLGEDISSTITALNGYTLTDANSDRVVAKLQPQPLSLVQEFTTSSGSTTEVDAELLRTYARIRISITNRSEDFDLVVEGLGFGSTSSAFGQNSESLLPVADADIRNADGNLSVTSTDAIIPFALLNIPCMVGENGTSKVAFDGYIYECKNANGLNYALDLEYPSVGTYSVYKKGNATSLASGLFMIGCGNGYYLGVKNHQLVAIPIDASETTFTSANAIWNVTKKNNNYYFQSAENTSSYIKLSSNAVELSTESSMLLSNNQLYNVFKESSFWGVSNVSYYLYVSNDGAVSVSKDNKTTFTFYSVTVEEMENVNERTVTIPLQNIVDGVSSPTSIIRRNDFFNVLVSVNYNKTIGQLEYQVQNWTTVDGNIEFN